MKRGISYSLLLLLGIASALRRSPIQQRLVELQSDSSYSCSTPVNRIKQGPGVNFESIAAGTSKFTDSQFPPASSSLYWSGFNNGGRVQSKESSIHWKRLGEIYTEAQLFGDRFSPSDIKQIELADCYWLAGISSVAEYHDRFLDIFQVKEVNTAGIYAARLYFKGLPRTIVVDDYVPMGKWYEKYYAKFAAPGETGDLWGSLMEKVWAKAHGNYQSIEYGWLAESYQALTGYQASLYKNSDFSESEIKAALADGDAKGYILGAGTTTSYYGLGGNHAFSVIGIHTLSSGTTLVHIRNPWSSEGYTGSWRDSSSYWTSSVKNELRAKGVSDEALDGEDDGHFFMPMNEFKSAFYSFTICRYKSHSVVTYVEGSND